MFMERFSSRFYNEATRERILNRLSNFQIENYRQTEDEDDNNAFERLVTDMNILFAMVLPADRTFQARKRYVSCAIQGTEWAHHARAKIRSSDDFWSIIEILHEEIYSISSVKVGKPTGNALADMNGNRPSSVLLNKQVYRGDLNQSSDDDEMLDSDVLFQRRFSRHPH